MNISKIIGSTALTLAATAFLAPSTASALIEGELTVGKRNGTFKQSGQSGKSLASSSLQLAGHLDPIPLIPVGFGLRAISETYDATVATHGLKSLTSTAIVPEVVAWIPLPLMGIKPFARVGYTLASAYKGKTELSVLGATVSGDVAYKSTGMRMAAGVDWDILPFISLTAAFEHSTETLSMTEGNIGGVDIKSVAKDIDFTSTAILIGAKVGI